MSKKISTSDRADSLRAIKGVKPSALADVYKDAIDHGCAVTTTSNGHLRVSTPDGGLVFGTKTASDHRAIRNFKSDLRRNHVAV